MKIGRAARPCMSPHLAAARMSSAFCSWHGAHSSKQRQQAHSSALRCTWRLSTAIRRVSRPSCSDQERIYPTRMRCASAARTFFAWLVGRDARRRSLRTIITSDCQSYAAPKCVLTMMSMLTH